MKNERIGRVFFIVGALLLGVGIIPAAILFSRIQENLTPPAGLIVAVVLLIAGGLALAVIGFLFSFTFPKKTVKKKIARYRTYPAYVINEFEKELAEMRAAYHADTNPAKNRIPIQRFINVEPYYDFSVLQKGEVYFAHLVEANNALFKNGQAVVLPAVVIYSKDLFFAQNPQALAPIAHALFENRYQNILRDETHYFSNMRLPFEQTEGREVYMTTIMISRAQLPCNCLTGSIFPIVAQPNECSAVFVLDDRYWTKTYIANYMRGRI